MNLIESGAYVRRKKEEEEREEEKNGRTEPETITPLGDLPTTTEVLLKLFTWRGFIISTLRLFPSLRD